PARVQDLGVGGAQHRLPHLLHDRLEPVLHDRHGDAVDELAHARPPSPGGGPGIASADVTAKADPSATVVGGRPAARGAPAPGSQRPHGGGRLCPAPRRARPHPRPAGHLTAQALPGPRPPGRRAQARTRAGGSAAARARRMSSARYGFATTPHTPDSRTCSGSSWWPHPVTRTTGRSGWRVRACTARSHPESTGMPRSVNRTSGGAVLTRSSATSGSVRTSTAW